ncbi:MAG: hypothetical protein IJD99_09075 [Clostridia bacterium]|nr:hypothetical protein [Clostridia bacterium]
MKLKPVLKAALAEYKKNFPQLCLALLVELVLRAIALSPLVFLADKALAPLAYLAIPLYILIALPARQNYALALQDMMNGGSVFSLQLISTKDYGKKLLRGVKGLVCILLWSMLTIAGVSLLYAAVMGLVDFITLMRIFSAIGGTVMDGVMIVAAAVAASCLLIVLGCAVHSGARHAVALGDKKLLKGNRLRLIALWFLGCVLVVPFAAVVVAALGDYALTLIASLKNLQLPAFTLNVKQAAMLIGGAVVLLVPLLPLKNLLPAVYLRKVKEARDAAA